MKPYYRQLQAILWLVLLASYAHATDESLADDLRGHLWFDLRDVPETPNLAVLSSFGGLVVDQSNFEEVKALDKTNKTVITYALTSSLDIGGRSFPDLRTLATLTDERLLDRYLGEYIDAASSLGADFLLLPDTSLLEKEELEVLRKLDRRAPEFFIAPTFNQLTSEWKRKELAQHLTEEELFITKVPLDKRLKKSLKKLQKSSFPTSTYGPKYRVTTSRMIREDLLDQIYDKAVVYARTQDRRSIPYDKPDIFLLTDQPFAELHQELERYYTVHNALERHPTEGSLILVDARWRADFYGPVLAQYDPSHQVFALVSGETDVMPEADEYLFFAENSDLHNRRIPQILYGTKAVEGRKVGEMYSKHTVYEAIPDFGRLQYAEPEWVGLSSVGLSGIESLARDMIEKMAAPGCQVTIIKNGAIIYDHAFGYLTYDSLLAVNQHTIYDVASVTKVMATLLSVMHLYERGLFQLDDSIAVHLPQYRASNKGHITIRQLLAHHAGLRSYEALWNRKFGGDLLEPFSYLTPQDSAGDVRSYGFPVHPVMADSIRSWLVQTPLLRKRDRYHYSDLGFMILQQLIEELSHMSLEQYVYTHFYHPMGLHRTAFNPKEKGYEIFEIAPTEYDHRYRRSLVWGDVHDRNAAIFGGVAGHAGLFSTSRDLAILMHMVMNDGYYAGKRYLEKETIDTFNHRYFNGNRRGLGWDKFDADLGNVSSKVSGRSFGHKGFTGTMVWADPEQDLVYTFVSNRIYPDSRNGKLMQYEVRETIQDVIYKSILMRQ